ncbi:MAG TPA: bifunctional 5,10-methylenetetrahydrofolate dehydrogenase/5,10-methenyltetrahydrofolate cyclohydrolase [Vicinamibacterales bacterium]|nr:bifunctional 5,10-methylenetetrahydrofolate dehydrogenase/5,10-methenyltetrahydrofolate cyclohydrolase [Vicinamibacterales bacterium]
MASSARRLDGAACAAAIRAELAPQVDAFRREAGRPPTLHIVLVGDDPASHVYVRNKERTGGQAGLSVTVHRLPASSALEAVLDLVRQLNADTACDGILVQSPLPAAMGKHAAQQVFDAIAPDKDVDCFNPVNVGKLVQGRAVLTPCTPTGVMVLLEREHISIAGKHAVVIGRSEIVGKPMALLLLQRDATVTICHSKTPDLAAVSARADILVAAVGRAGFVTRDFVKPGATVIDVGINRVDNRVVGDVHPEIVEVAGALTPVPGGVGPLTIAMLLRNTLIAAQQRRSAAVDRR